LPKTPICCPSPSSRSPRQQEQHFLSTDGEDDDHPMVVLERLDSEHDPTRRTAHRPRAGLALVWWKGGWRSSPRVRLLAPLCQGSQVEEAQRAGARSGMNNAAKDGAQRVCLSKPASAHTTGQPFSRLVSDHRRWHTKVPFRGIDRLRPIQLPHRIRGCSRSPPGDYCSAIARCSGRGQSFFLEGTHRPGHASSFDQ